MGKKRAADQPDEDIAQQRQADANAEKDECLLVAGRNDLVIDGHHEHRCRECEDVQKERQHHQLPDVSFEPAGNRPEPASILDPDAAAALVLGEKVGGPFGRQPARVPDRFPRRAVEDGDVAVVVRGDDLNGTVVGFEQAGEEALVDPRAPHAVPGRGITQVRHGIADGLHRHVIPTAGQRFR
jgi:hypothetical protein